MSGKLWQEQLQTLLTQKIERLAIVGIGHELRGDDAAGVFIARELQRKLKQDDDLLILDAGVAPENVTGQLRRFEPTLLLLLDAVEIGQEAGTIEIIDLKRKFVDRFPSTHSMSLALFVSYLKLELACDIYLLGVQVQHTMLGEPVSPSVKIAVNRVVDTIDELSERKYSMTAKALEQLHS